MSFTLRSVCVYSHYGDCRIIKFHKSGLNILTGLAKTGKSSIIDILDYCFGRDECYVAEGVVRQYVSWFGVEIENLEDILFVARRNPGPGKRTSSDIYIRRGRHDRLPTSSELHKTTTADGLVRLLTRFAGIAENEHRPLHGTRRPLKATIRHALFLCIQRQDEIASRDRLFHRQGEQFIPQAIKDTLPFFLGAVDEDHFLRQNELDNAKEKLRHLENRKDILKRANDDALHRIRSFVLDGRRVGLIDGNFEPTDVESAIKELTRVLSIDPRSPSNITSSREVIVQLEDELQTLRQQLIEVQNDVRLTEHFIQKQTDFSLEVHEQHARLVSIDLYKGSSDREHICPLCESQLQVLNPAVSDLSNSLELINRQLETVGVESPHLQKRLDTLGRKRMVIKESIAATQRRLARAYSDDELARRQRDQAIERARVVGRISAFLDQTSSSEQNEYLDELIAEARRRVEMLAERVGIDDIEEHVYTFLNLIAVHMTDYAKTLKLEHAEDRIRLDPKKLSVVAETVKGPIPLNKIGSGENWVGYHVVTFLALHRWFRERNRAVPGILLFDQPSQAHFPPDVNRDGSVDALKDEDRLAVRNLFRLMHGASQEIGRRFQLIVLDHARLYDDWFETAIVEEWRSGKALVPVEWTKIE